jgi:hypothetical protein
MARNRLPQLSSYEWTLIAEAVDNLYHDVEEQPEFREDDRAAITQLQILFNGAGWASEKAEEA